MVEGCVQKWEQILWKRCQFGAAQVAPGWPEKVVPARVEIGLQSRPLSETEFRFGVLTEGVEIGAKFRRNRGPDFEYGGVHANVWMAPLVGLPLCCEE